MTKKKLIFLILMLPGLLRAHKADTKHLALHLSFDWQAQSAIGVAEFTFQMMENTSEILLDAGRLQIDSVICDTQLLTFQYNGGSDPGNLLITLSKEYPVRAMCVLTVYYRTKHINHADPYAIGGSFGKGLRFHQPTSTTPLKRKQIWSSGEPDGNIYWFPCNADMADIHTTEMFVRVDTPLLAICNGKLLDMQSHTDGTRTFHYASDQPFPNYLVSLVVGEYEEVSQSFQSIDMLTYGYPDEIEAVRATVVLLPDMLQFLTEKTGYGYPLQEYRQVVVQDYPFPGLVGQYGTAILSDNYIDDYGVHQDYQYLWDGVAMQALANQWFGNLIMPESWKDLWLNNAFAQYFAGLYTIKCNAQAEYMLWYHPFELGSVLSDMQSGNIHPIVPEDIADLSVFTNDSYSKYKGALVLRMLQLELGDELWWKAVQTYVNTCAYKQVTTKDFQRVVESVAGRSLQWFFDQWVFGVGIPEFTVRSNYTDQTLTLSINQTRQSSTTTTQPQIAYFEGTMCIEIDGITDTIYVYPQAENTYTYTMDQPPGYLHMNVDAVYLCLLTFDQSAERYLQQLQNGKGVSARKEALDRLAIIALDTMQTTDMPARIRTAIQSEVRAEHYWRYRMYALNVLSTIAPTPFDEEMRALLQELIAEERSWLKFSAITLLGTTSDSAYVEIYLKALKDSSDRVIHAAAIALGKTKSKLAFDALMQLENRKTWKNQNRISALYGLQQLGDPRAIPYALSCLRDNTSARWYLAMPLWDYPFSAAHCLHALGATSEAFTVLSEKFAVAINANDVNDIFQLLQLMLVLGDEKIYSVFDALRVKYKEDARILEAVGYYEKQFQEGLFK